ncbi:unnamed protein product [Ixodes persulcatus]
MLRVLRANHRARRFLASVLAFTLLFACRADRGVAVRKVRDSQMTSRSTSRSTSSTITPAPSPSHHSFPSTASGEGRQALRSSDGIFRVVGAVGVVGMVRAGVQDQQDAVAWQSQALTVVGLLGLAVFAAIVAVVGRKLYRSRRDQRSGKFVQQQPLSTRSRLFSRDRLNTTDYMHTLATLDRKLAMDEILEKRRRAVFLQQIRCHTPGDEDDVFLEEVLFCPEPSERPSPNNIDSAAIGASRL